MQSSRPSGIWLRLLFQGKRQQVAHRGQSRTEAVRAAHAPAIFTPPKQTFCRGLRVRVELIDNLLFSSSAMEASSGVETVKLNTSVKYS